jgi:ribose 5-phosphate isomerase B
LEVIDHGAVSLDGLDDYPDFIAPAAQAVAMNVEDVGIIFGESGQGEAMVANRVSGVRATVYYGGPVEVLTLSRGHNNANMLSIGAGFVSIEETLSAITIWSEIPFSNDERDIRRLSKF